MKKLLLFFSLSLFLAACENDFDVAAPWKEIPVVYGILSPVDTAHYLRIEKAFIDPDNSALGVAQIADSLYYPADAISVWLEEKGTTSKIQLSRVDGALEGYPRKGGIFAQQPNWLYKAKSTGGFSLKPGKSYRLVIKRADGKPDITAETTLPGNFIVINPSDQTSPPNQLSLAGTNSGSIIWNSDVNGYYFNVTLVIRYREKALNGTTLSTNTLVWEAAKNVKRSEVTSGNGFYRGVVSLTGTSFYNFLSQNLTRPAPDRYREFATFDIILDGGGYEIKEYLETAQANSGLTGAETFPNYSNISEGYGIFTARNRSIKEGLRFTLLTVDSMNVNSLTDTLGFRY
jgi:hypothetical protein